MSRQRIHVPRARREAWEMARTEFIRRAGSGKYLFGTMMDRQTGATRTHYFRERLGVHHPARKDGGARRTRGVDGQTRWDAWRTAQAKGPSIFDRIAHRVRAQTWAPDPLLIARIREDSGKVRVIAVPTVVDRVVLSVLLEVLEPLVDPALSPAQHGYRPTTIAGTDIDVARMRGVPRGSCLAVGVRLLEAARSGYVHLAEADIKKAFPSVNRTVLQRVLMRDGCPVRFAKVITRCLGNKAIDPNKDRANPERITGIPLGNPCGPLLFNLYVRQLHDLDLGAVVVTSYADNFFLAARSDKELGAALQAFEERLREDLLLDLAVKQRWCPQVFNPFCVLRGKKDGGWRIHSDRDGRIHLVPPERGSRGSTLL